MGATANKRGTRGTTSTPAKSERNNNVKFMTVEEFKKAIGAPGEEASVVKNPNTGKLFVSIAGDNFKCQQDINGKLPMRFLIEDADLDEACLVNVNEQDNTVFTL
jgi:hypothetical protein